MKRLFDILCSAVGLFLLMPGLVLCGMLVRLSSPGPILFRQERVGLNGQIFEILKFRTMRVPGAGPEPQITVGRDPRITAAGAFLRRWKLDELPQLWNVLVGDMSLVGPRPEVPRYVELYPPALRQLVLSVRPGITDPCSIYLRNESEILGTAEDPERFYVETLLPEKLRVSASYIQNRSIASDIAIILKTIFHVGRNNQDH